MILLLFDAPGDFEARAHEIDDSLIIVRSRPGRPEFETLLRGAKVIAGRPTLDDLDRAASLQWLQLSSAGADKYVSRVREDVVVTNASGVYGIPTAEHALSMMLAMARRLHEAVRAAANRQWNGDATYDELYGSTCGILGFGDIGSALAERLHAFGVRILAYRRTPNDPPPFVEAIYGPDGLFDVLEQCDHIVNVLPATPSTHHLIGEAAFSRMKTSAILYNVGRGSTVDETALVRALGSGTIAGAGLDVFEREPLPPDSPLWNMPNVLITPHRGGSSPHEDERVANLLLDNLRRRAEGRPLRNVVDRTLGY